MKRTLTTGLPSVMDYVDDGNLTKDGPWDYVWDADGARQRVDGAPQCGVPGAKRRVRKAGALWATDEQNQLTAMTMKTGLPDGMICKRLEPDEFLLDSAGHQRTPYRTTGDRPLWAETDEAARRLNEPVVQFTYDYLRRWVEKKVIDHWDVQGEQTTVTHLRYVYDGHNLIAELDGSTTNKTVLSTYVWGLDLSGTMWGAGGVGGLLMVKDSTKIYFPAYDGNGNLSALLDSADGSLDAKYEYGAFGEPLRVGGTAIAADNPFRFSTKYTDVESGLVYYGFRYYSPSLGRFLNRDPLGELGGSNLYAFVENDPVNGWDRFGLEEACDPGDYSAGLCDEGPRRRGFFQRLGRFFGSVGSAIGGAGRAIGSIGQGLGRAVDNVGRGVVNIGGAILDTANKAGMFVAKKGTELARSAFESDETIGELDEYVVWEKRGPDSNGRKNQDKPRSSEKGQEEESDGVGSGDGERTRFGGGGANAAAVFGGDFNIDVAWNKGKKGGKLTPSLFTSGAAQAGVNAGWDIHYGEIGGSVLDQQGAYLYWQVNIWVFTFGAIDNQESSLDHYRNNNPSNNPFLSMNPNGWFFGIGGSPLPAGAATGHGRAEVWYTD